MPLKLNVGLSRKVGEANYGSRGASVNIELELDAALAADSPRLQQRIRQLFALVRTSVAEELRPAADGARGDGPPNGAANATNGQSHAPASSAPRPATANQIKALHAIARGQGIDLTALLHERFQATAPEALTLKQASALIDELKLAPGQDREGTRTEA